MRVLYFAWLKERVGVAEEQIAAPPGVQTVDALMTHLATLSPRHAAGFAQRASLRCAVNQELAGPDSAVAPGDEVAFFPPVTGG